LDDIRKRIAKMNVSTIPYNKIHIGERFRKDYGDIKQLVISIRLHGLHVPVIVKQAEHDCYELLAGGRRMVALADVSSYVENGVPAVVLPANTNEYSSRTIELIENIHRKQLEPMEEIHLKAEITRIQTAQFGEKSKKNLTGWNQEETAKLFGVTAASISDDIQLSKAAEMLPELNAAKTKAEAKKILSNAIKNFKRNRAITQFTTNEAGKPANVLKKKLMDSYIIGDARLFMTKLKSGTFDLIEIDPPYAIDLEDAKKLDNKGSITNQTENYIDIPSEQYLLTMQHILAESYRVAKPNAWIILWFAPEPWFEPMFQLLTQAGWESRRMPLIWSKRIGQTKRPDRYMGNAYEMAFYGRKGNAVINKARNNVYDYRTVNDKEHATEKPIEMYEDLLYTFVMEGSNILVPFAGSGNSLLAAANIKCTALGYDLLLENKSIFDTKILEQNYGEFTSYKKGEQK